MGLDLLLPNPYFLPCWILKTPMTPSLFCSTSPESLFPFQGDAEAPMLDLLRFHRVSWYALGENVEIKDEVFFGEVKMMRMIG